MNKETFNTYITIEKRLRDLTEQKNKLREKIFNHMSDEDIDQIKADDGTFFIIKKKRWSYSQSVTNLQDKLANKKKEEEATGTASYEISPQLQFRIRNKKV